MKKGAVRGPRNTQRLSSANLSDIASTTFASSFVANAPGYSSLARRLNPLNMVKRPLRAEYSPPVSIDSCGQFFRVLQFRLQPFGPGAESLSRFAQFPQFGIGVIVIAGLIGAAGAPNIFGHQPSVSVNKEQPIPTLQVSAAVSLGNPNTAMPGADRL
jgi:hypothetical protein